LLFSSFLGGTGLEQAANIAKDSLGRIYVCGWTESSDFPITVNAMHRIGVSPRYNGFVSIFDADRQSLVYSTFLSDSGDGQPSPSSIRVESPGKVWIVASAWGGMATTEGSLRRTADDQQTGYFAHLDFNQNRLIYGSYLPSGMQVCGIIAEDSNHVWLSGYARNGAPLLPPGSLDPLPPDSLTDMYVCHLELPSSIDRGTFLGGAGNDFSADFCLDSDGAVIVIGESESTEYPTTPDAFSRHSSGSFDAVLTKLSPDLTTLEYSTYLGGTGFDGGDGISFYSQHAVWLWAYTNSRDFPLTPDALYRAPSSAAVIKMNMTPNSSPEGRRFGLPDKLTLSSYPNPFNPTTTLTFSLPKIANVQLEVFDILGRSVYVVDLGRMNAGSHQHVFDGSALASGVYFAKVKAERDCAVKKMLLIR
jgi:hypothetical protein